MRPDTTGPLLAIECSTGRGSVALSTRGRVLGETLFPLRSDGGRRLAPSIDALLRASGARPEDLAGVAVSVGPGSFTGVRLGLSTARAIAFARGLPLYAAGSLLVLARGAGLEGVPVCALQDARKEEVYAAIHRFGEGGCRTVMEAALLAPALLAARLPPGTVLVGAGATRYRPALEPALTGGSRIDAGAPDSPRASDLAALVHAGGGIDRYDPDGSRVPEPVYIRRPEAEVRWAERQTGTPGS